MLNDYQTNQINKRRKVMDLITEKYISLRVYCETNELLTPTLDIGKDYIRFKFSDRKLRQVQNIESILGSIKVNNYLVGSVQVFQEPFSDFFTVSWDISLLIFHKADIFQFPKVYIPCEVQYRVVTAKV